MFENKILIIDSDLDRVSALETVLQFIDCKSALISDELSWQECMDDKQPVHAVLIGETGKDSAESVAKDIHKVDPNTPVFLLMEGVEKTSRAG